MQQLFQANNIRPLSNEEGESHNFLFLCTEPPVTSDFWKKKTLDFAQNTPFFLLKVTKFSQSSVRKTTSLKHALLVSCLH